MKIQNIFGFCLLFMVSVFVGCGNDDDDGSDLPRVDLLTRTNGWVLTSSSLNTDDVIDVIVSSQGLGSTEETLLRAALEEELEDFFAVEDCEKDDSIIFNADGSIDYNNGGTTCPDEENLESSERWQFNADETKLAIIDEDNTGLEFDIVKLNSSTMELLLSQELTEEDLGLDEEFTTNLELTFIFSAR